MQHCADLHASINSSNSAIEKEQCDTAKTRRNHQSHVVLLGVLASPNGVNLSTFLAIALSHFTTTLLAPAAFADAYCTCSLAIIAESHFQVHMI